LRNDNSNINTRKNSNIEKHFLLVKNTDSVLYNNNYFVAIAD